MATTDLHQGYRRARERRQDAEARLAQAEQERRARRCPRAVALLDELRDLEARCRPFSDQERRIAHHVLTVAMALRYESDLTAEQADQIRAEVRS